MEDLIEYLTSLVMTTVQIDTKYRQTIPTIIANMKPGHDTSDEERKRPKKRSKKPKVGKDGLYPMEAEHVERWWTVQKAELLGEEGTISQQQIKSHLDLLRTRETELQMIIIFEILALEPLRSADDEEDSQLPGLPGKSVSPGIMAPPPKKRNRHNLPVLVDVHADRLCIWHSTASDELRLLEGTQGASQAGEAQSAKKASSEPLRDFCVDIIMPL
jgi:DNA replication regulator SLD3